MDKITNKEGLKEQIQARRQVEAPRSLWESITTEELGLSAEAVLAGPDAEIYNGSYGNWKVVRGDDVVKLEPITPQDVEEFRLSIS